MVSSVSALYEEPPEELLEEEEPLEEELPEEDILLLMAARVFCPATPSAERPFLRWKLMTASFVMLPKWPVTEPE